MAKKVTKKEEPLSLRDASYKQSIREIQETLPRLGEPTYFFKVGDKVLYGSFKDCVIDEVLEDGKVYGVKCVSTSGTPGSYNYKEVDAYRHVTWVDVRPIKKADTYFEQNDDIRIRFIQQDVYSLIRRHHFFGVDFEPDYQRESVWDDADREALLESIFLKADIGKFVFVHLDDAEWSKRKCSYEIVDGKQRLLTLLAFFENRFPYKGKYYNDLSSKDKWAFKNTMVTIGELENADKETILRVFIMLNRGGKPVDDSIIEHAKDLLKKEQEKKE